MPSPDGLRRLASEMRHCEVCTQQIAGRGLRFCSHDCYKLRRRTVDADGQRTCRDCSRVFDETTVRRAAGNWCADCRAAYYRAYNARIGGSQRTRNLRKYGITPEDYDHLLADQGGCCAICREPSEARLHVDHCHNSGRVRGLLCFNCNVGLGKFRDNTATLLRAVDYLLAVDVLQEA